MLPQEAPGGWMPRPRNDNDASARMAKATLSEAWTTIGGAAFGRTWCQAIRQPGAPRARERLAEVLFERVIGRQERRAKGHQHGRQQNRGAERRQARARRPA